MKKRHNLYYIFGSGLLLFSGFFIACNMENKENNQDFEILTILTISNFADSLNTPTLTAEGGNLQITLTWDTVAGAESYNIYHSASTNLTNQSGTKIANVSSPYVHLNQQDAVARSYIVMAVRGSKEGPASIVQTAMAGTCGNSVIQAYASEACDDGNEINDNNGCSASCKRIGFCGDNIRQSVFEACDTGGINSPSCDSDCTAPACGDGIRNAAFGEVCDDGNLNNGDGCNSVCSGP